MSLPSVNNFRNRLSLGGARANYYLVNGPTIGSDMAYLARSTSLPAATVNAVEVMTPGGRKLKYAGERTFEDWTVSVYNDTQMITRRKFEAWQTNCANWDNPLGADALNAYGVSDWTVTQLSRSGVAVRSYRFHNMWPSALGSIELSFDEQSSIEQFDVTFSYSHYRPVGADGKLDSILAAIIQGIAGNLSVGDVTGAATTVATEGLQRLLGGAASLSPASQGNADSDAFAGGFDGTEEVET